TGMRSLCAELVDADPCAALLRRVFSKCSKRPGPISTSRATKSHLVTRSRSVGGCYSERRHFRHVRHFAQLLISFRSKVRRISPLRKIREHAGLWHAPCFCRRCEKQSS